MKATPFYEMCACVKKSAFVLQTLGVFHENNVSIRKPISLL
jgi:hypothetical protein